MLSSGEVEGASVGADAVLCVGSFSVWLLHDAQTIVHKISKKNSKAYL